MLGYGKWSRKGTIVVALAAFGAMALPGVAFADNVVNDVDVTAGDNTITTGGTTTIGYKINATGVGSDGQAGCNASDATPATLTLSVPADVTASRTSLTFTACNAYQPVTFSSVVAGDHHINVSSISDAGVGSYENRANWTLRVIAPPPPPNTAPSVSVSGVTDGASYEIGSEPSPSCEVTDAEDGNSTVAAVVNGTLSHGLGTQTATCDHIDKGGLAADTATATYTIVDTGNPTIGHTLSPSTPDGDNGWYRQDVAVTFTCADAGGSGIDTCVGDTALGEGEDQSVTGTATDWAGNTATDTVPDIDIDKTAPVVALVGGPGASYYYGNDPAAPTCDASDALSGLASCEVTGGGTSVGAHSYTATATDNAGNTATATLNYTVLAWTTKGYNAPVDMGGVLNTVKGGSTVPLKFELFAGPTELTSTSAVTGFKTQKISCTSATGVEDAIELLTTGGTSLRFDTTAGQFVQNWKTPTGAGSCYAATMTSNDGSTITALFKIK
ncbi:PxKF domain-containing protein [Nocardioides luteus]|uniref:Ig-like domain-containing protein n=1 Tax=Nocardioides luteus TaxID=1844 RepID=A0A1J4NDC3_9ACTN|nr:PxKF domain-containing protein [Nocardioides luteus]OIJ28481.1 hypothetical protein UG56_001475 [Nocardioides luteus]